MTTLREILEPWSKEDLGNLCSLLEIPTSSSVEKICDSFKWRYYSKSRASAEAKVSNVTSFVLKKVRGNQRQKTSMEERRAEPSYENLISGACKHLKVFENDATTKELETFLVQDVIIAALQRMKPRERKLFFEQQVDVTDTAARAGLKGNNLTGPLTTMTVLGLSQASGFGIYMASTTALGFLTHAVGVTLPFAVFSGMTSTIAFVIGPPGWLAAAFWGFWKLTGSDWKVLIQALVYVITVNSRKSLEKRLNTNLAIE